MERAAMIMNMLVVARGSPGRLGVLQRVASFLLAFEFAVFLWFTRRETGESDTQNI